MTTYPRFWSDDFDMGLLKVLPDVEPTLRESGTSDVVLYTHGRTTHGRLNHPNCWNHTGGFIAFFGLTEAVHTWKPAGYVANGEVIPCTWLEVVRDCWSHDYAVYVDGKPILDGNKFRPDFEPIMWHIRKWHEPPKPDSEVARHVRAATERILAANTRFVDLFASRFRHEVRAIAGGRQ